MVLRCRLYRFGDFHMIQVRFRRHAVVFLLGFKLRQRGRIDLKIYNGFGSFPDSILDCRHFSWIGIFNAIKD